MMKNSFSRKSSKPVVNYVNPDELKKAVIESQAAHSCSDRLAQILLEMHARIFASFPCFKGRCRQDVEDA